MKPVMLSVLVIVYRMPRQAHNTLFSLSAAYQRHVSRDDYEVVVVENRSDAMLDPAHIAALDGNFRYYARDDAGVSPAAAINFGAALCQGELLGLIIDGAHMLSPGVLHAVLAVRRLARTPLVAVPGYHLGDQQHDKLPAGHADLQLAALERSRWREDGYRLFAQACFSPANKRGYLHPLMECNALFCTAASFRRVGGADESFAYPGGGSLNLHLYRSLGLISDSRLVILPGEGSFHQHHGGVTTAATADRQQWLQRFREQVDGKWGGQFRALAREPLLLGKVGATAQPFLETACNNGARRFGREQRGGRPPFADDPATIAPPAAPATTDARRPQLSIVVVVHQKPRQALNTLFSLSRVYQREVDDRDYEVIVVENASSAMLVERDVIALGGNFRYYAREESMPTPAHAINFGVVQASADHICLIIDGACLVTPRMVRYTLDALALYPAALVAVPGYHLDQNGHAGVYDEDEEQRLLQGIDWRHNGYALFDIASLSGANPHGFFHPLLESHCLSFAKAALIRTGGAHPGFQLPGGGNINLDIYRNLALLPESRLIVLPGEGSFHQFHDGANAESLDLEQLLAECRAEFRRVRGENYTSVLKEPTLYGAVTAPALRFLVFSSQAAQRRYRRFEAMQAAPWPHDSPAAQGFD